MLSKDILMARVDVLKVFDKVTVLYEGRQIYFGRIHEAKEFFTTMGFECPRRQTTADFLTSLTSPSERVIKPGYENKVPRTPDEFAAAWKNSTAHAQLMQEIKEYEEVYPVGGESLNKFIESRRAQQSKYQ
jgi:ABC-type multidrug transport system ATPase subunit